ncbi:hypothetical protein K469DRAFT_149849 [Zopfia rhizophila CBS 207.26]|uniref:Uncharacterized protein n=1 Tax=Zopfia rhizophila CBS 207.26 TaxID=1314779 RepID=A0A6A6E306_9PEZI|nr:hypothetical protein K469DRAFT_149849 [Zopfia rhizophila CBS 207.26]
MARHFTLSRSLSDEEADSGIDQESSVGKCEGMSWSADQFWSVIERLHRLSLVQSIEKKPASWFSIHPVVRGWLQLRERKRLSREKMFQEAIKLMNVIMESFAEVVHWSRGQQLLAHLDSCQINSQHIKLTKAIGCAEMRKETNSFGRFYQGQGRYDRSNELFEVLLKGIEIVLMEATGTYYKAWQT